MRSSLLRSCPASSSADGSLPTSLSGCSMACCSDSRSSPHSVWWGCCEEAIGKEQSAFLTARGAPPPRALARGRRFAALPSGPSLGPQALSLFPCPLCLVPVLFRVCAAVVLLQRSRETTGTDLGGRSRRWRSFRRGGSGRSKQGYRL